MNYKHAQDRVERFALDAGVSVRVFEHMASQVAQGDGYSDFHRRAARKTGYKTFAQIPGDLSWLLVLCHTATICIAVERGMSCLDDRTALKREVLAAANGIG